MFGVTIFAVTISSLFISAQGLSYSFNGDFAKKFDKQYCVDKSDWYLFDYSITGVKDPEGNSRGIIGFEDSCATSPPELLKAGGALEVYVYMQVTSESSGIAVVLTDASTDVHLATFVYNGAHSEYAPGWSKVIIPIQSEYNARISLIGHSLDSEIIIAVYMKYIKNTDLNSDVTDTVPENEERIVIAENLDDISEQTDDEGEYFKIDNKKYLEGYDEIVDKILEEYIDEKDDENVDGEVKRNKREYYAEATDGPDSDDIITTLGPTDPPVDPTVDPIVDPPVEPAEPGTESDDDDSFWFWIIIGSIAAGSLIILTIIAVSFYYLGKSKSKTVIIETDVEEPPRTVVIPRVKEVVTLPGMIKYD